MGQLETYRSDISVFGDILNNPFKKYNIKNVIVVAYAKRLELDLTPSHSVSDHASSCLSFIVFLTYEDISISRRKYVRHSMDMAGGLITTIKNRIMRLC